MGEAEKAAEVLQGASDDGAQEVDRDETETFGELEDDEPDGIRRLFRTDKAIDLNERVPWWDPEEGGANRIGAAIKQMGGWEFVPPIVWLFLGMLELVYNMAHEFFFPEETDDQGDTDDVRGAEGRP